MRSRSSYLSVKSRQSGILHHHRLGPRTRRPPPHSQNRTELRRKPATQHQQQHNNCAQSVNLATRVVFTKHRPSFSLHPLCVSLSLSLTSPPLTTLSFPPPPLSPSSSSSSSPSLVPSPPLPRARRWRPRRRGRPAQDYTNKNNNFKSIYRFVLNLLNFIPIVILIKYQISL